MPQFRFRAARPDGTIVEDRLEGDNEGAIRTQLEGRGWLLFSLEGPKSGTKARGLGLRRGRLSLREFLVFNQEFVALVRAGLPVLKVFDLLAERAIHPAFREALHGVRTEVRGGASMSEAMARYPAHFPDLYRASLSSGEHTGNVVEVLQRYISYLKLVISVREKVVKALAYPVFLVAVGVAVVAFLLVYVMPTFAEIYGQNKTALPAATQLLLSAVERGHQWLPWVLAAMAGGGALLYKWSQTTMGREQLDRLMLLVPVVGGVLLKSQVVRFARTLATILAGGLPLMYALQITTGATTNRVIANALIRATDRVKEGVSLAAALKQEGFLPQMTLEMIEVGETTGSLVTMLQDVAEFHEGELELQLNQLTTWIEPLLLLIMGFLVGGIVIVMYLPVFQIAGTV